MKTFIAVVTEDGLSLGGDTIGIQAEIAIHSNPVRFPAVILNWHPQPGYTSSKWIEFTPEGVQTQKVILPHWGVAYVVTAFPKEEPNE